MVVKRDVVEKVRTLGRSRNVKRATTAAAGVHAEISSARKHVVSWGRGVSMGRYSR